MNQPPHDARRARSLRSTLLALASLLTLLSSGCATTVVGPWIQGPPPALAHLHPVAPLEAATVHSGSDGAQLTLRLRLDDDEVVERTIPLAPEVATLPVLLQLDVYGPDVDRPVRRLDAGGHPAAAEETLTAGALAGHLVVVVPPERTGASLHTPGQRLPVGGYQTSARPGPLRAIRRGAFLVLLPVLLAVDAATLPIQLPILIWELRGLHGPIMT